MKSIEGSTPLTLRLANGLAILLSSSLLFLIQPIAAKEVLSSFGGSASVWLTCLMFFQLMVLFGYIYTHLLVSFVAPRIQAICHFSILIISIVSLFSSSGMNSYDLENPTLKLFLHLARTIGFPVLLLAANSPLIQFLSARAGYVTPYRLYALSNFGSLLGLFLYPFTVEALLSLSTQKSLWRVLFVVFAASLALCWRSGGGQQQTARADNASKLCWSLWFFQSFSGSLILLAVTNFILQDVASVPLFWVLPLAIYLLSFTLTFERSSWYGRNFCIRSLILAFAGVLVMQIPGIIPTGWLYPLTLALTLTALFVSCFICHGELALLRPKVQNLTEFYVVIALGGAAGGIAVNFIAPVVFTYLGELPVSLMSCIAVSVLGSGLSMRAGKWVLARTHLLAAIGFVAFGFLIAGSFAIGLDSSKKVFAGRNFYGTLRVTEQGSGEDSFRRMVHGRIIHGLQFTSARLAQEPTAYFGRNSAPGLLLQNYLAGKKRHIAVVGLGAGVLAAYGENTDVFEFFEINPQVIDVAREYFTFLSDSKAEIKLIERDGRLGLREYQGEPFDMVFLDAFSGDSVPTHLISSEAVGDYLGKLKSNGVIVFNVSNIFLDLAAVAASIAEHHGLAWGVIASPGDEAKQYLANRYVVISRSAEIFDQPYLIDRVDRPEGLTTRVPLWTDEYSSIWKAVR